MRITITLDCDNDAFGDRPVPEADRLLNEARFLACALLHPPFAPSERRLLDSNGNTVGFVRLTTTPAS